MDVVSSTTIRRVAMVQFRSSTSKEDNLERVLRYIDEASRDGASLVAFPEFTMAYSPEEQDAYALYQIAEGIDGRFVSSIRERAKVHGIYVVVTMYERGEEGNRVYDTALLIDGHGSIVSVYRKIHLYDALGFRESAKLLPGSEIAPPAGISVGRLGMMICYDLRFPEMARILALLGAEVLVVPSAWVQGRMKYEHWQTMLRARAIENGCYIIAPDQVGNIYIGHSMAIDPFGTILVDMGGEDEGLSMVEVDVREVYSVRSRLPLLSNRRMDVYSRYADAMGLTGGKGAGDSTSTADM
ncbi:MAG: carbon-nitrogen hydrolase family protein [Candidatus Nitrosocaldus sp.]|nr:carbon-nitrogen hydrolase family protein [Candidatus Nitrosocaldus sp.]MDW7999783.1 carbon-nitrogen hydrolase family protein [Candidatus Nitrosocaldus sp.]